MSTMKLTALFAVMSMATGIAFAQPVATTGTAMMAGQEQEADAKAGRGQMGGDQAGPFGKLRVARSLPSVTDEQKQTIDAFMEQRKPQAETMRTEMRTAMQQAKQATDRQARQAIMQPLRQKMETAQQEVDALLTATLTPEQLTEVNQKAGDMMKQAGRERMRGNDAMTTGAKAGRAGKAGNKGAKGKKTGRDGQRNRDADGQRNRDAAPMAGAAATTGTETPNPFATTE